MKKLYHVAVLLLIAVFCFSACAQSAELKKEDVSDYTPFWTVDTVRNETVLLKQDDTGKISGTLLFEPIEVISVKSYDLLNEYDNKDYRIESNLIIRAEKSDMPYMTQAMLRAEENAEKFNFSTYDGLVFTETTGIVVHYLNISYTYSNSGKQRWKTVPQYQGEKLANLQRKLNAKEPVNVLLYGDSIAAGCHASSILNYNPFMPIWGKAVCNLLAEKYATKVNFYNGSVGGWLSQNGARNIIEKISLVPNDAPDLAIIAFGMNDGTFKVDGVSFKGNIMTIINTIRESAPDCDIVLISTILANPDCSQDPIITSGYKLVNDGICSEVERCININMTDFSKELYSRKSGIDLLANNINHPSDFFVRCYVMNIMASISNRLI